MPIRPPWRQYTALQRSARLTNSNVISLPKGCRWTQVSQNTMWQRFVRLLHIRTMNCSYRKMFNTKNFDGLLGTPQKQFIKMTEKNKLLYHVTSHIVCSNEFRWQVWQRELRVLGGVVQCDIREGSVDKKNQLDVTFCILYFYSNSCSTCFGQPCAHHQELTTVWCYSLVLVCAVAAGRWSSPVGR